LSCIFSVLLLHLLFCYHFIIVSSHHLTYLTLISIFHFHTSCRQYSYLTRTSFTVLSIVTCPCSLPIAIAILSFLPLFFSVVILNLIPVQPISLYALRFVLTDYHSAALSRLTVSYHPDLICLTETWITPITTLTELAKCTPPNYTLCNFPRNFSNKTITVIDGGTGFLIREPFK